MSTIEQTRGARVIPIPPPLYYAIAFGLGRALNAWQHWPLPIHPAITYVGAALIAFGIGIVGAGIAAVVRHRTTIVPHRPVAQLLTSGIYGLTRNPMYVGLAIAYVGVALATNSPWPILTLPLALVAIRRLVIDPEERYLADRFSDRYANYRRDVRRWL